MSPREHADCYLMWIETVDSIGALVADVRRVLRPSGRSLSLRFAHPRHRARRPRPRRAAPLPISSAGSTPTSVGVSRSPAHDHQSEGVRRQDAQRAASGDDGFVEDALWTGIGVARSGVGAAITGSVEQVEAKLRTYAALGIDAFILSGYPLDDEAERVAALLLPRFELGYLAPQ